VAASRSRITWFGVSLGPWLECPGRSLLKATRAIYRTRSLPTTFRFGHQEMHCVVVCLRMSLPLTLGNALK
jgi:hypothetical protein